LTEKTKTEEFQRMKNQDPTLEQIAAACLLIRSGWSDDEKLKRLRVDLRPQYRRCDGQRETFDAAAYETHHSVRADLQEVISDELE
jgi:hypothetical protein